jgi:hypothetical protein
MLHGPPRLERARTVSLNCKLAAQVVDMMDLSKQAWDAQPWRVLTGGKCFEKTHDGTPFFEWLQAHPKVEHGFSRAMGEIETLGRGDHLGFFLLHVCHTRLACALGLERHACHKRSVCQSS